MNAPRCAPRPGPQPTPHAAADRTMQPNHLPILCLPMDLSDQGAASLLEFLYQLADAIERHYAGQLLRYAHRHEPVAPPDPQDTQAGPSF